MKLILAFILLLSPLAIAQDQPQKVGRYQIAITAHGIHSVFRVDTVTGAISYCYPYSASGDLQFQAIGVKCVSENNAPANSWQ